MVFAKTDIGKAREQNQDFYYISESTDIPQVYILADRNGTDIKVEKWQASLLLSLLKII